MIMVKSNKSHFHRNVTRPLQDRQSDIGVSKSEFLIELVSGSPNTVGGAVIEGEVVVGMIFSLCYQFIAPPFSLDLGAEAERSNQGTAPKQPINLQVKKIIAYQRELASLPRGMTGELVLEGSGEEHIRKGTMLVSA